jgi:hypothetical protein
MSELTPEQTRTRDRFESLIEAISPALDFVLDLGDRVSRRIEPEDPDYHPVRSAPEPSLLGRGAEPARDD